MTLPTEIPVKKPPAVQSVSDSDMEIFVGQNWKQYEPTWRALRYREKGKTGLDYKNFNWMGFLVTPAWFLYRKMYISLVCYIVGVYALEFLLQILHLPSPGIAYCMAIAISSRMIYIEANARRILQIRAEGGSEEEIKEKIAKAGGVSKTGGIVGCFVIALYAAFVFFPPKPSQEDVQQILQQLEQQPPEDASQVPSGEQGTPPTATESSKPEPAPTPIDGSIDPNDPNVEKK